MVILEWLYEYWLPVVGYEGMYEVSNFGRIKSLNRWTNGREKFLTPNILKDGRRVFHLTKDKRTKGYLAYRLVAQAFFPNPNNLPEVNHKDENPSNDCVWNLEYCDAKYNSNYGTRTKRGLLTKKQNCSINAEKPVLQYSKDGKLINSFVSINQAARETGTHKSGIQHMLNGKTKTAGGFIWKYA